MLVSKNKTASDKIKALSYKDKAFLLRFMPSTAHAIKKAEIKQEQLLNKLNNSKGLTQFQKARLIFDIQENYRFLKTLKNTTKIN